MFERFTDRARKVMALANQEAQRFNHEHVGTEHILLGLVKEGSGVGANVLKNFGVDLSMVRLEVEKLVKRGPDTVRIGRLPPTPRAEKVIQHACEEARGLNHNYVGTEHLLLGLLREQDGVAAAVLLSLGLKLEGVRQEVVNLLGVGIGSEESPTGPAEELGEGKTKKAFARFTDRARKAMALANQEAQRFNHEHIGSEHILLGLVKEGSGVGANVLKNFDVDLRRVRLEVEKLVKRGPEIVAVAKLPQTPRAKKVIEYAIEESRSRNHNYVGTEHLLLGLLRERDGVGARVLMNLGLKLESIREEVLELLEVGIEGEGLPTIQTWELEKGMTKTPDLGSFRRDLTERARAGKLDPLVGRKRVVLACGMNVLVPGCGLILLGWPWLGASVVVWFALAAELTTCGHLIAPATIPALAKVAGVVCAAAAWLLGQGLLIARLRLHRDPRWPRETVTSPGDHQGP